MYALTNCQIYTGQQTLSDHALLIEDEIIVDILPTAQLNASIDSINLAGASVAPGFIDLQLNGCGGVMFNDAITASTLNQMHQTNLISGTTSYLPTLITAPDADMVQALTVVEQYRKQHPWTVLGLHLEGPYLNLRRKGIHQASEIRQSDRTMLQTITSAGCEVVRLVTLAPEQVTTAEIRGLAEAGIVVSAGHTDATYEQAIAGFEAGIKMVTHLFNAMSPWQGRSPGMVGAVLDRDEIYAGIIADGYHTHFASIALAKKIKRDRLILVTDATSPVGTHLSSFQIGGQDVFYQDGRCISADGTLGGSALTMIQAVTNCVNSLDLPLAEALRMASLYPAQAIGLDDRLGQIAPNFIANLVILKQTSNQNLAVSGVVDCGQYLASTSPLTPAPFP